MNLSRRTSTIVLVACVLACETNDDADNVRDTSVLTTPRSQFDTLQIHLVGGLRRLLEATVASDSSAVAGLIAADFKALDARVNVPQRGISSPPVEEFGYWQVVAGELSDRIDHEYSTFRAKAGGNTAMVYASGTTHDVSSAWSYQSGTWKAKELVITRSMISRNGALISQTGISPQAKHHITEIVDALRKEWLHRDTMNWTSYHARVVSKADSAQTVEGTYEAIRYALELLGDKHSHYVSNNSQRIFAPTAAALRADRCSPPQFAQPNVPPDIGYIRVRITPQTSTEDIQKSLRAQAKRAVTGWVVDLRNSRGGSMWPALTGLGSLLGNGTAGYFIDNRGDAIPFGYSNGHSWLGSDTLLTIHRPVQFAKLPRVAVLTDAGVLSSGEAIAIAFRFRPNTRSFGARTCGVSSVTRPVRLSNGGMIVITVGYMADRMKNKYGGTVEPDELIPNSDDVMRRAISWLQER